MVCDRCGADVPKEDLVQHGSQAFCEDCAMDAMSPAKACDPWAVKMATGSLTTQGDAVASLTGLPKDLYDLVQEKGRVPHEQLPQLLGASASEVTRAYSTLRHMELLRGDRRPDGGADLVPFDTPHS